MINGKEGDRIMTTHESTNELPIYKQIENYIMDCIHDSRLQKGMIIPSEENFCEMFKTSRMTVRKAIDELVGKGILYRIKGKGTFVNKFNVEKTMNISTGWKETMMAQGHKVHTKVLNFCYVEASEFIAKNLNISKGTKVVLLERLRYADDLPVLIEKAYLNASILQGIMEYEFNDESLYRVFENHFGIKLNHVYQKLYTKELSGEHAKLLFNSASATCIVMENTSYDNYTRPIEFTICYINGERYTLRYVINN